MDIHACTATDKYGHLCGDTDTRMTDCCNTYRCYEHRIDDGEGNTLCKVSRYDGEGNCK